MRKSDLVIILEKAKFDWKKQDIETVKEMLRSGVRLSEIAERTETKKLDLLLLILHLENEEEY
ncbi:hypothetical protein [Enterococcus sp. DIV0240a]|uniref:hypothetical protein n=1 Tax=unclassified Enterococcus TaxID=2608891 RepID=UPI003D26E7A0